MSDDASGAGSGVGERPLLIVGMHRSGTSLAASLLAGAGIDLGANLLGAGTGNLRGHFEDLDFLDLHKRVLLGNGLDENGYACPDHVPVPAGLAAEARRLVDNRRSAGHAWGWKEPRTTLLLDFYRELLPAARFLCVFRRPWEVVDSLLRRGYTGDRVFDADPGMAARACRHYSRLILELAERIPDRCLVVEATQLAAEPERVVRRVGELMGTTLAMPPRVFDNELMHMDGTVGRAAILSAVCPESIDVYLRLRSVAGSDSPLPSLAGCTAPGLLGEAALREWARHAGSARDARAAAREAREARGALETAHAACAEAHGALRDAIERRERLARHAAAQAADLESLRAHAGRLATDLDTLRAHAAAQAAEFDALRAHAATQAAEFESLRAHAGRQAADLDALRAHAATQAAEFDALRAHAGRQAADLDALLAHAAAQAAEFDSLRTHAGRQATDLDSLRTHAGRQAADLQTLHDADAWHRREACRLGAEIADLRRQLEDRWSRRLVRLVGTIAGTGSVPGSRDAAAGAGDGRGTGGG